MLQLRVYGDRQTTTAVAERLEELAGVRHISRFDTGGTRPALVTADLTTESADAALATLDELGVGAEDVALLRLDVVGSEPLASGLGGLVWADVLGTARIAARTSARFLVLMAVAGVIAALAVMNDSSILLVGAMAISPDLLPITATCAGLVLRRPRLARRGLAALLIGLAVTALLAAGTTGLLRLLEVVPDSFVLGEIPAAQTRVSATTVIVALSAGVAGMLAVETRASYAVGVAISVTTIPAAAYLGVAAGLGELGSAATALGVLGANILMMLIGGSATLATQRLLAQRNTPRPPPPSARASRRSETPSSGF